jgi:ABC-type nitrate/sulfonate/bicarbonate transport system substrate-binding protein
MLKKICNIFGLLPGLIIIVLLAGCRAPEENLEQVTLQLNWYHCAEFVGYYMAESKGFYRDSRLDVNILEGSPNIHARNMILDGRADFAIASFDEQINLLAEGAPSVAVMTVFQIPPLVMFALADSGINEPEDLIGKRIGIKNDYWLGIARKTLINAGIDPSKVIEVIVPADAQHMLYSREVDVWMGYAHDEPVKAEVSGYQVTNIYPADYGVGGYEGLLLSNEKTIAQKEDMVKRFVNASKKGLQYSLAHLDESAEVIAAWQKQESLDYYKLAVGALIPLVDIPQSEIGCIDAKRWEQMMGNSFNAEHPGYNMQFLMND